VWAIHFADQILFISADFKAPLVAKPFTLIKVWLNGISCFFATGATPKKVLLGYRLLISLIYSVKILVTLFSNLFSRCTVLAHAMLQYFCIALLGANSV
jgi:hypothetical protein